MVLILGTSITAGYGVEADEAYPARIRELLDGTERPFEVRVRGEPGSMSSETEERLRDMETPSVGVLVLEMGANDALVGFPVDLVRRHLEKAIGHARRRWPGVRVVLLEIRAPPDRSPTYRRAFRKMYRRLSEREGVSLVAGILQGVAGRPEMTLDDGLHPDAEGHRLVAERVWSVLRAVIDPWVPYQQGRSANGAGTTPATGTN